MSEEVGLLVWPQHLEQTEETNLWETNQDRITVIDPRADEGMDNRGKDIGGDGASDCSKTPQVEVGGTCKIGNMFRKGKGAIQDYAKVSYT